MVNICESLINVVRTDKPNGLIGLDQKGKWSGIGICLLPIADVATPADLCFGYRVARIGEA
jgi:hypothetical protein